MRGVIPVVPLMNLTQEIQFCSPPAHEIRSVRAGMKCAAVAKVVGFGILLLSSGFPSDCFHPGK